MSGGAVPAQQAAPIYLEDLIPGRRFTAGPVTVSAEEIIDFARQYDPSPSISMMQRRNSTSSVALPPAAGIPRR
ncbi:hypothetical protein ACFQU2_08165 [Siccirubricoccus deserti]